MHDWNTLLSLVIKNANGETLDGQPGDYEAALYQLISEAYEQTNDDDDKAVLAVLITLHQSMIGNGKVTLWDLTRHCISLNTTGRPAC